MCTVDKLLIKGIRSFSPENVNVVEFFRPLTLIVGQNGAGKTTIIECLKQACTGALPPNTRSGQSFIHDPKVAHETEVKGQIKLRFVTSSGQPVVVVRSFSLTQKKAQMQFKTLDSVLQTVNAVTGEKQVSTYRCIDIDKMVPQLMGVSKAVLENVIFVHQEDSNWPLSEGKVLKDKFDDIFSATKYSKALESLRALHKERVTECKQKKLKLETVRTLRDQAGKLQEEMARATEAMEAHAAQITQLNASIQEQSSVVSGLEVSVQRLAQLRQQAELCAARLEELDKQAASKRAVLQGEEFEEGAEEIAAALEGFDARIEALRVRASRQAREVAAKRLEIQSMGDAHTREVARHGRLLAEKAAYDKAVQELDSCVADLAARLSLPLPGGPRAAGAAPPSLTPQAVLHFRQALAGKVEEKETALRQLKEANRRRDEEAAGLLDSFTRQTTRKQEELRLRRQQAQQNYSLRDSLAMQCEALVVNEHALNEAEQRLNEVSDALRSRTEEQAVARLDEKLAREKREIDEVTARIAELRSERDKAAGANESVTRLRLKQAEIRQREDSLNALLRSKRAKLLHLLGSPAELPPLPALPAACDRALAALRSDHAERQRGMTELQAKESRLRGELASARLQAQSAEQHTERLRESLRAAAVSAGLPGLLLIGPGSPAGGSLATPGPLAGLVGRHPGSSVDAQLLEREIETRKKAAERAASIHAQSSMLAKFLRSTASSFCTVNECPACKRPFNSEEERQASLQAVEEELQALPARVEEMRTQQVAASAALDAVTALRPLSLRVQEAEGASLQELRDRVANLEAAAASASASAQAEAEEVGMSGLELDEASRLVQEGVWQLDRAAKELQALREEVGRLETGLAAQATDAAGGVQRSLGELDDALEELELSRQGKEAARESTLKRQARMREEVLVLTRDLSAAREQLTTAKTRMERKVELQTKIAELEANSAELLRSAAAMEAELAPLNQQREAQAAQRTTARSAMQAVEDREEGQLRGVRALADQLQAKVAPVEEYRARGQASDLADSTTSMRNMQDRMAALTQEVEVLEGGQREAATRVAEQEGLRRRLQDCLELRRLEEQRGQLLDQIAGLEQEQGQAGGQAALEAQLQAAQAQVAQLTRQRDMLSGARATQQEVRNRAAQQLKVPQYNDIGLQYTQLYGEVMYSDMANADLEKYNKALEKALLVFHTTKMSDINKIVKELWQKTYRGQDIDYVQIKADADGARNYNYRVVMYNGGAELEMRGRCSAGQKVLACLIIRLALAETFCLNCGILALDEPTTNLDRENSASLAEALRAIMLARKEQENFQLIVITHDEAFAHQIGTREHADYLPQTRMPRDQAAMNRSTSAAVRIGVISASAVRLAIGAFQHLAGR